LSPSTPCLALRLRSGQCRGTLSTERAQELILSMFPQPQRVIGHIPRGTEVADPANDPQLLAETADHWWVEAYLPGLGWRDFDPCFASAGVDDVFVESIAADGTDRIAEVPDDLRHKVTMRLKVELDGGCVLLPGLCRPSTSTPVVKFEAVSEALNTCVMRLVTGDED
jgi:hypothetical protein